MSLFAISVLLRFKNKIHKNTDNIPSVVRFHNV